MTEERPTGYAFHIVWNAARPNSKSEMLLVWAKTYTYSTWDQAIANKQHIIEHLDDHIPKGAFRSNDWTDGRNPYVTDISYESDDKTKNEDIWHANGPDLVRELPEAPAS